jgi:nitrite reductase/ring-hydroxylating ferredoxin subunit
VGHAFVGIGGYLGTHLTYNTGIGVDTTSFQRGPEEWTPVEVGDLPEGRPVGADVAGVRLVLVRDGGHVRALAARCTHRGGPLDQGDVDGGCITCPWHGSRFDLATGDVVRGPATQPQPDYDVREVAGRVEVRRVEPKGARHPAV